jgi:hypothetical protein
VEDSISSLKAARALLGRFSVSHGAPVTVSAVGDTTVYTPIPGNRIRLKWIGLSTPNTNTDTALVTVSLGGAPIYAWDMGNPGAFAHGTVREGPIDGVLAVNLSAAQTVRVNFDLEEFQ